MGLPPAILNSEREKERDLISWFSAKCLYVFKAFDLKLMFVSLMLHSCLKLNQAIESCTSLSKLKQIHALGTALGLSRDHSFTSNLICFAALYDSASVNYAHTILSSLPTPTVFNWNTVIRGFSRSRNPNRSLSVFVHMLRQGFVPDHLTYPFLARVSARLLRLDLGGSVHCRTVTSGFESDKYILVGLIHMYASCGDIVYARKLFDVMPVKNLVSWNAMLDGYAKCGDIASARQVFDSMQQRNVVSWSSLIDGYVKSGDYGKAMEVFQEMLALGYNANEVTMVSVLCACAHLGALDRGRMVHRYIFDRKLPLTLALCTSLVDMYAKCGEIEEAVNVFQGVPVGERDVLLWNAMIGGFATHGLVERSLVLFGKMQAAGVRPDEVTYLCLLSACAHVGLVRQAWHFFECMGEHKIMPKCEHYACMVDVLARAGQVEEAYQYVSRIPIDPTSSMLGALLSGCINHKKLGLAEIVGRKLIELQPDHDGRYIGLSNVYTIVKRWNDARTTREAMEMRGVKKCPGFSCVEVSGSLHRFIAHDKRHSSSEQIHIMLDFTVKQMKVDIDMDGGFGMLFQWCE